MCDDDGDVDTEDLEKKREFVKTSICRSRYYDRFELKQCPSKKPNLELGEHIGWSDDLERNILWDDYIIEFPTLSFEIFSFFSSLSFIIEPPILLLDIRK